MLLLGARNGVPRSDLIRIELVTGGTITQFEDELHSFTELRVEPGTEVQAIRDIVFNPDLRYVSLNISGPVGLD